MNTAGKRERMLTVRFLGFVKNSSPPIYQRLKPALLTVKKIYRYRAAGADQHLPPCLDVMLPA
jgi:hypothetical protein